MKTSILAISLLTGGALLADLGGSYVLPLDDRTGNYETAASHDDAAQLQQRLDSGTAKLTFDEERGYLPSLLKNLNISPASQVLVFSKTSFQAGRISRQAPRALYFNDNTYVGWVKAGVQDGEVMEVSSMDPELGAVFYVLDQKKTDKPKIARSNSCLQCHASPNTLGVPGLMVRSVYPDSEGQPVFQLGSFITDHRSPLKERWGGWYVTGSHGDQVHMGNVFVSKQDPGALDTKTGANVDDLNRFFNVSPYLTPHSDLVALMVLEHQTRMHNLITRVGYETRMALRDQAAMDQALKRSGEWTESTRRRIYGPADELVKYMLFAEETPLAGPVKGTSAFAAEFAKRGPFDKAGRSLRQFDLSSRMFRYPCSYLMYSDAFNALPAPAKDRVYLRLWEVLSGKDTSASFARLSSTDRRAIREILLATKADLPEYWKP